MLTMPTRRGWTVSWYTGEITEIRYKNGYVKEMRRKDSYESTSKEDVLRKKEELEKQGYEIEMVTECIF